MWLQIASVVGGATVGGVSALAAERLATPLSPDKGRLPRSGCGRPPRLLLFLPLLAIPLSRGPDRRLAWRFTAFEVAHAALWWLVARHAADAAEVALGWALACLCVWAAAADLQRRVIPNRLTGAAALVWLPLGVWSGHVLAGLEGAAAFSLPLLLMALWRPAGVGMGDVKLAAVAGLYVGWPFALPALFTSMTLAFLFGLGVMVVRRVGLRTTLPLAPFLALGSLMAFLAGGR